MPLPPTDISLIQARAATGASEPLDGHTLPPFLPPGPTLEKVQRVIKLIRPAVQADGGDVELLGMTESGEVYIRLHGACVGCPSSSVTLQVGIERNLRAHIPEVKRVVAAP